MVGYREDLHRLDVERRERGAAPDANRSHVRGQRRRERRDADLAAVDDDGVARLERIEHDRNAGLGPRAEGQPPDHRSFDRGDGRESESCDHRPIQSRTDGVLDA